MFTGQPPAEPVRRVSHPGDGLKDGSVLRRVAKVTLDQATKDVHQQKPARPKHVPEKLDFKNHEKFEGKRAQYFSTLVLSPSLDSIRTI